VLGFLSLIYPAQHNDTQFHPFSCKRHNFMYSIMCLYHIFFIYLSVVGHLGWVHMLGIMSSAVKTWVCRCLPVYFILLQIYAQWWYSRIKIVNTFSF
jgi:hypothetical protein